MSRSQRASSKDERDEAAPGPSDREAGVAAVAEDTELDVPARAPLGRAVKTSERVAAAIVSDIVSGGLGPGDRLPNEATMLDRFRVGRASLREALRILEVHGLINLRSGPGGGPVVTAVDPRDVARTFSLYLNLSGARIRELVEARLFLEPMVARLAAERADRESLRRLERALEYEASIPVGDSRYVEAANNFHYTLGTMTSNKVVDLLSTALKELYSTRSEALRVVLKTTDQDTIRREHREIGEAILAGEAEKAEQLMREHMGFYLGRVMEASPAFAESTITWD